jgi:hypothetical protein
MLILFSSLVVIIVFDFDGEIIGLQEVFHENRGTHVTDIFTYQVYLFCFLFIYFPFARYKHILSRKNF